MNHKDSTRLSQAVEQYLLQRIEQGYPETCIDTQWKALQDFRLFVERQPKEWNEIFTFEILKEFMQQGDGKERRYAVRGLAKFLYQQKQISQPIPLKSRQKLPEDSERIRPLIPKLFGHPFRSNSATYSKVIRPAIPI